MPADPASAAYSPGIRWDRQSLELLDQRLLPGKIRYVHCATAAEVAAAIQVMVVRGAPAIGIVAAYGVALGARQHAALPVELRVSALVGDLERLGATRPTAVNLVWALARLRPLVERGATFPELAAAAEKIHAEDVASNQVIARLGSARIEPGSRVLTHCNTGPLATGGVGTAFGVIASAWHEGRLRRVACTETRPWFQGARITTWELSRAGIAVTLMTDIAAAGLAFRGGFDWLVVGADRIAANGDVINKIGTTPLAALIRRGGGRVMAVAPWSSVDLALASGDEVALERRGAEELWRVIGTEAPPRGVTLDNPVFDVTPATEVDLIVTERGVMAPGQGECPVRLDQGDVVKFTE